MKQWTPKAELYDFGRPFPAKKVIALFSDYAKNLANRPIKVFEPGCGTGRVLLPLAQNFPNWQFVGMDSAPSCLDVLRERALEKGLSNISVSEGSVEDCPPNQAYDLIIHSSVLHVISNWSQVLKSWCTKLADDGAFCLIGDYGDIYSESLGRSEDNVDPNLSKFWKRYIALRKKVGAPNPESSQVGCRWDLDSTEIALWLEQNNFYESKKAEVTWIEKFSRNDLIRIVEERCYSAIFTLDAEMVSSIVSGLKSSFDSDEHDCVSISRHKAICRFYKRGQHVNKE